MKEGSTNITTRFALSRGLHYFTGFGDSMAMRWFRRYRTMLHSCSRASQREFGTRMARTRAHRIFTLLYILKSGEGFIQSIRYTEGLLQARCAGCWHKGAERASWYPRLGLTPSATPIGTVQGETTKSRGLMCVVQQVISRATFACC